MSVKEKRLLIIALIIFLGYMLPFYLIPMGYKLYEDYRESIDYLQSQIERYEKLRERADYWETENQKAKQIKVQIEAGLLQGNNRELVGAKMQGLVRELAQKTGITFKSLDPPDFLSTGEWVLVIQSMHFEADSQTLIEFLKILDNTRENLAVVSLEVRSYRKKLSGTVKITGFSRLLPLEDEFLESQ